MIPRTAPDQKLLNSLRNFFSQAVASFTFNICLQFCKAHLTHLKPSSVSSKTSPLAFSPPTLKQIKHALKKLDRSTAEGYFGLPVAVLIHCADALAPPLLELYKRYIDNGDIPATWKWAIVTPLYKGIGLKTDRDRHSITIFQDY